MKRFIFVLLVSSWMIASAQNTPTLTITSPSSGLLVQPGQSLTISVSGTNPPTSGNEELVITDPTDWPAVQAPSTSNQFTVTIPTGIGPGSYSITAVESSASTNLIISSPIVVTVSPTYSFDSLSADVSTVLFSTAGETSPLVIQGTTFGVSQLVSNQFLTFVSANPAIATVDSNGIITPQSAGTTTVSFSYGNVKGSVTVLVGTAITTAATQTAAPTFTPVSGTFTTPQTVTISDATSGAAVYYTTDGTAPSTSSALYSGPITVNGIETIQAIATASGYTNSAIASAVYTIKIPAVATPSFSPAAGTFTVVQTVTISDATAGAAVYYTTNGTAPTTSSTLYSGPITISSTETLQAVAVASGYTNSAVASAVYTINLPQDFTLGLSASSLSIEKGQSGMLTVSVAPVNGFSQPVSFACSGLPSGTTCNFSPATITPSGTGSGKTTVTITASATAGLLFGDRSYEFAGVVAGISLFFAGRRLRRLGRTAVLLLVTIAVASFAGCGGGKPRLSAPTTSTISINAISGSLTHAASFSLSVQ